MVNETKKVAKMSVVRLTQKQIAKKKAVSVHTVRETMKGRRKNPAVIEVVNEWNEMAKNFIKS